jgi:multisubunit Na+/H+ antiporter MnhG subunit
MSQNPPPSERTTDELRSQLHAIKRIHTVIFAIFGVILIGWFVTGGWSKQPLLLTSTIAMMGTVTVAMLASRAGLVRQVRSRESAEAAQASSQAARQGNRPSGE